MIKKKDVLFINQNAGYLMIDIINVFKEIEISDIRKRLEDNFIGENAALSVVVPK